MEKIVKPWGMEELLEVNENYVLKRLTMHKGHRCSLQYHEKKKETIFVLSGDLKIYYGKDKNKLSEKIYTHGEVITILPGEVHRMEAVTDSLYLETSTPELDDVIRISDDYMRDSK